MRAIGESFGFEDELQSLIPHFSGFCFELLLDSMHATLPVDQFHGVHQPLLHVLSKSEPAACIVAQDMGSTDAKVSGTQKQLLTWPRGQTCVSCSSLIVAHWSLL